MKKLLSIVYLLALAGSVSAQIGPESAFTRTLKTNTTATAWANALTNGFYTPLVDHFYPKSVAIPATAIGDGSVGNTEFQSLNGVTSAIQTQLDGKFEVPFVNVVADSNGQVGDNTFVQPGFTFGELLQTSNIWKGAQWINTGTNGLSAQTVAAALSTYFPTPVRTNYAQAIIHLGQNDILAGRTAVQLQNDLSNIWLHARSLNYEVAVINVTTNAAFDAGEITEFLAINTWIAGDGASLYDALIDADAIVADDTADTIDGAHWTKAVHKEIADEVHAQVTPAWSVNWFNRAMLSSRAINSPFVKGTVVDGGQVRATSDLPFQSGPVVLYNNGTNVWRLLGGDGVDDWDFRLIDEYDGTPNTRIQVSSSGFDIHSPLPLYFRGPSNARRMGMSLGSSTTNWQFNLYDTSGVFQKRLFEIDSIDGNLVTSNNVTVASPGGFTGDGSGLTSIPAAQLSGVVPAANGGAGATTGILKADGAGLVSAAVAGTDYLSPASNLDATKLVNEVPFAALPTGAGATDVAPGDHDHTSLLNIDAIRAKAISSPVIILGTVASTSTTLTKNRAHTVTVNSLTNLFNFPADPTTNDWVELIINSTSSSSQLHFAIGGTTNYMVWEGRGYTSFSMTNVTGTAGISRFGAVYDGTIWRPEAIGDAFAPSAAVAWGAITGTLSGQTDLQSALDAKESSTSNNIDPDRLNGDSVDDNLIDDGLLPSTFTRDTEIAEAKKGQIFLTLDGNGSAISTGQKGYVRVPWSGTITGWEIVADTSGNIVVDVWKDTYANFPPTDADSIAGSELPTLSGVQKNTDTSLTWTGSGAVTAGDWIGWNVDSASTVTRVHIALFGTKN